MRLLKWAFEKINKRPAPYYYNYSILTVIKKMLRKWITNSVAYNCPFNNVRIFLYRLCGFDIGRRTFIGMHCYLDDLRYDLLHIGNDVVISYGVYFACHGKNQQSQPIIVKDGAYIGMRASIISKTPNSCIVSGGGSNRRKCSDRFLHAGEPKCAAKSYRGWHSLQNYRENSVIHYRLRNEVAA